MTIRLSDLTKRERTVLVRFDGTDATLTVTYRPDRWTPAAQSQYARLFDDKRSGSALALFVAMRATAWDLVDDAGAPIPLTEEALETVDTAVLDRVVAGIFADLRPTPDDPKSPAASPPN